MILYFNKVNMKGILGTFVDLKEIRNDNKFQNFNLVFEILILILIAR